MREIKFRARRINDGEFVYGQYVEVLGADGKKQSQIITKYTFNEKHYEVVDPETVQQFCGYDVEGNEFYEGDVLSHPDTDDYDTEVIFQCFSPYEVPMSIYDSIGSRLKFLTKKKVD